MNTAAAYTPTRLERRVLVALRSGPLYRPVLDYCVSADPAPVRAALRELVTRGLVTHDAPARVGTWCITDTGLELLARSGAA